MKIACIIDSLGPGGAQRQMVTLATFLKKAGHQPIVFIYHPEFGHFRPTLTSNGIDIVEVATKWKLLRLLTMRRLVRNCRPSCIVSFLSMPNIIALFSSLGIRNIPVLVSDRNTDSLPISTFKRMRLGAYQFASAVTCNSESQANFLRQAKPILSKKLSVIYNGLDVSPFTKPPPLASRPFKIIALSSICKRKNLVEFVNSIARLRENHSLDIRLDWFGQFTNELGKTDDDYHTQVKELAANYNKFFRIEPPISNVEEVLHDYHALCLPSRAEGCPNAVCEAMASFLPIISSDIGDLPAILTKNNFLFTPGEPESIEEAISRLYYTSSEDLEKIGRYNRERACELFSLEAFGKAYLKVLVRIAGQR
jgi:glycosyltransferase involved in cell wall biosynthesis